MTKSADHLLCKEMPPCVSPKGKKRGSILSSAIIFLGGSLAAAACIDLIQDPEMDARNNAYHHAIKVCESTIPRNRFCDAKWVAEVKPLNTTLTGKGTGGKDIIIERKAK